MRASEFITEAKYSQSTIDSVKKLWDSGDTLLDIGKKLNLTKTNVQSILKVHHPDRQQRSARLDQDTIDLVKISSDEGKTPAEIAKDLNLSDNSVASILARYYPERVNKAVYMAHALTDDDKKEIVLRFKNGDTTKNLAKAYAVSGPTIIELLQSVLGKDVYNNEIKRRKSLSGTSIPNKITPKMLTTIRDLYTQGKTLQDISDYFDNIIGGPTVHVAMKRQPDYAELRAKRDERKRKINTGSVATTKIHRPGTIDNQHSKGPNSKHTNPTSKFRE